MLMLFGILVTLGIFSLFNRQNVFIGISFTSMLFIILIGFAFKFLHKFIRFFDPQYGMRLVFLILGITLICWLFLIGLLIFNTYVMNVREGKKFTNKLSAIFGINLLIVGILLIIHLYFLLPTYLAIIVSIIFWLDVIFSGLLVSFSVYSFIMLILPKLKSPNYIIVLGSWVKDGKLTPLLKGRLDKALEYSNDVNQKFIVSGGQGSDESVPEAVAMADYLKLKGVSSKQIILETRSNNTFENLKFSKQKIVADWNKDTLPSIIVATSDYHVLRTSIYAKKIGLKVSGIGARTPFFFLPSAIIREFLAILYYYRSFTTFIFLEVPMLLVFL